MGWNRKSIIVGFGKGGELSTFVLTFNFSLVEVSVDLDYDVLPSSESIGMVDDTNEVVLDSWFQAFHETIDFHLLHHVKMGGELKETGEVVKS